MDLYLGLKDMPIYNFDQALQTDDMSYMVVGWDERKEFKYMPINTRLKWDEIYNKWCERVADNEVLDNYSLTAEVSHLETRYTCIYSLIECLCELYKEEIGLRLNKWGVPFNIKGKIKDQLPLLNRHLKIAKQNLDMKTRKLKAKSANGEEDIKEFSLMKQVIIINEQLGIKIDMRKDSVDYFIAATERLKEKLEHQKISNGQERY